MRSRQPRRPPLVGQDVPASVHARSRVHVAEALMLATAVLVHAAREEAVAERTRRREATRSFLGDPRAGRR